MSQNKEMNPISGEPVETDGVYSNEWGRTEAFRRGDTFPGDTQMGTTEWELVEHRYDEEMREGNQQSGPLSDPKRHVDRGDK